MGSVFLHSLRTVHPSRNEFCCSRNISIFQDMKLGEAKYKLKGLSLTETRMYTCSQRD